MKRRRPSRKVNLIVRRAAAALGWTLAELLAELARHCPGEFSPPLPVPTDAAPGSPKKLAVLVARAAARQEQFHPSDAIAPGPRRRQGLAPRVVRDALANGRWRL